VVRALCWLLTASCPGTVLAAAAVTCSRRRGNLSSLGR